MRTIISTVLLMMLLLFSAAVIAEDTLYKPFVVASSGLGTLDDKTQSTRLALEDAGFEVVGQYAPVDGTTVWPIFLRAQNAAVFGRLPNRWGLGFRAWNHRPM